MKKVRLEDIYQLLIDIDRRLPAPVKAKKYMTAAEAEQEFGINQKTLLNRSTLPPTSKRFIPSLKLKGGRRRLFERKVLQSLIKPVMPDIY